MIKQFDTDIVRALCSFYDYLIIFIVITIVFFLNGTSIFGEIFLGVKKKCRMEMKVFLSGTQGAGLAVQKG